MEIIGISIKGLYRDVLKGPNGNIIYDSGWVSNTIVDRCRKLLAGFMKNDPSSNGIQYMAVGKGRKEWDDTGARSPEPTTENLVDRYPITIPSTDPPSELTMVYIEDDTVVAGPTNRLQITATLKPGYPAHEEPLMTYPLREFGLFGKFGGEPYMINCIRHPVIHKDVSATLIRVVRLYF